MTASEIRPGCEPASIDGGRHGALVVHGFTGCPQSVQPLARALADAGLTVKMPLLPGHGTSVDDMVATTWADWSGAAEDAYLALAERCDRVVVAGLSMGGTIASWLSTRHGGIAGIVCINPAMRIDGAVVDVVRDLVASGQDRIPAIAGDIADPDAQESGYEETPLVPLLSLAQATDELRPRLGEIRCPTLIMTSPQDHTVAPADSDELASAVGGPVERVSLDRSYHVATLDHDRDLVREHAVRFVLRVTQA